MTFITGTRKNWGNIFVACQPFKGRLELWGTGGLRLSGTGGLGQFSDHVVMQTCFLDFHFRTAKDTLGEHLCGLPACMSTDLRQVNFRDFHSLIGTGGLGVTWGTGTDGRL